MNEQPEALRLADELAIQDQCDFYKVCEEAALELRWLHEENERLREAVAAEREACAKVAESYEPTCDTCPRGVADAIRARGEQEQPR